MLFPYVWIIAYDEVDRLLPEIYQWVPGMPAFFPGMFMNSLLDLGFQSAWPAVLLTAMELGIGIWLIQLGPKRTLAYLLFVALTASMGSLVFHALCLAWWRLA